MEKAEKRSCFGFSDYRDYLRFRLPTKGAERGLRARLAEELRCQSAYVSRVLAGESDFSLEHAVRISAFLGHSDLEREYFLQLVHEARAGTHELKEYYRQKREEIREKWQVISERIQVKKGLSVADQLTYYSSWLYAAVHVMLTVPGLRTAKEIARHLRLTLAQVQKTLDFLESCGLAERDGDSYRTGQARIHLGHDSPMISKHHANWRMQATQAADRTDASDLFFSGPISVSAADAEKIRAKLMQLIEEVEPMIRKSKEEVVLCLNLDLFRI